MDLCNCICTIDIPYLLFYICLYEFQIQCLNMKKGLTYFFRNWWIPVSFWILSVIAFTIGEYQCPKTWFSIFIFLLNIVSVAILLCTTILHLVWKTNKGLLTALIFSLSVVILFFIIVQFVFTRVHSLTPHYS